MKRGLYHRCFRPSRREDRLILVMFLLAACTAHGQSQFPPASADQGAPISVNVDLVVLHATVRDTKGHFVSDLKKSDFEVYEDGLKQSLRLFQNEDVPVTVGLVVDHSGSMRQKMDDVIEAARTFVQHSNPNDQVFVVNFSEYVTLGLPAAIPFSNRVQELQAAIMHAPTAGQTALYDAIGIAFERLQAGSHDKKVLIVISDGADNASRLKLEQVLTSAGKSSTLVYTIGIFDQNSTDRNPRMLKHLSQVTGGEAFFPGERSEIVLICESIARDIRHQYTLGYVSSNAEKPGTYRRIQVTARASGSVKRSVRTRAGYIAVGEEPNSK